VERRSLPSSIALTHRGDRSRQRRAVDVVSAASTSKDPLTLVPLGTMTERLRKPFVLANTPAGSRYIFEVESGTV
jgi:hypothetical protein